MRLFIAFLVAVLTAPPGAVSLTSVRSTREQLWFSNPVLGLKGTITPIPGSRFDIVVVAVGDAPIEGDVRQFTVTTVAGASFEPIAIGGGADLIFPLDSIAVGREMGQILPNDAQVIVTRTSPTRVTVAADPHASLAFVFQVPHAGEIASLHLPDGTVLPLGK